MLVSLSIDNVAIIEKAEVEFEKGFNVLTGETGAGKSLLIDSLSMVLGMRTSREIVRTGAPSASVSALFAPAPDLSDLGIEPEEDSSLLLSRKLTADGRNICRINSAPVPLSLLRAVGERLVTIHGQNDSTSLLKPSFHLTLLDSFSNSEKLISEYRALYDEYISAKSEYEKSFTSESEREQKKDMLKFRIDEINSVSPKIGEDEELLSRREMLRNFSSLTLNLSSASGALSDSGGARDALYGAMKNLEAAVKFDSSLSPLAESVTDIYYSVEDIASELSSRLSSMTYSPEELEEIESRLDSLSRLKKKYGPGIDDCLKNLADWENEYGLLSSYEENISRLEEKMKLTEEKMLDAGRLLEENRSRGAKLLSEKISSELAFLDMPKVKFGVRFSERAPNERGLRSAEFLISTNPSEPLKPLSKIASGGEMSRIMLAIRSVLADCDSVGLLLFDEIDTGVSGRAASKIAKKLRSLASGRQVISVTHLPQMAAEADYHFLISKDTSSDSFRANVSELDYDGRVKELSRLISGEVITDSAIAAAKEMLSLRG